jgi:hypothetical protein
MSLWAPDPGGTRRQRGGTCPAGEVCPHRLRDLEEEGQVRGAGGEA